MWSCVLGGVGVRAGGTGCSRGERGAMAINVRISDHPAFVRAVVDFVDGPVDQSDIEANDPRTFDGTASVRVTGSRVRKIVLSRRVKAVRVRVLQRAHGVRIDIQMARGRFKYLSYSVPRSKRLAIDVWKSAPPSRAAVIRRGALGCLSLRSLRIGAGVAVTAGREHGLFEHQFQVLLRGHDGRVLSQTSARAVAGRWRTQLRYRVSRPQPGTLEAVDLSAKDGALACLVQVRIRLQAALKAPPPPPPPPRPAIASVYVTDTGSNSISEYDVATTGMLTPKSPATIAAPGVLDGIAISPDRRSVYVTSNTGIAQYDVLPGGVLRPKSPATLTVGTSTIGVAITPDGKSLYATAHNGVLEYDIGPGGLITPKAPTSIAAGSDPRGIVVSPDGTSAYATDFASDTISEYSVAANGVLSAKSPATIAPDGGAHTGRDQS